MTGAAVVGGAVVGGAVVGEFGGTVVATLVPEGGGATVEVGAPAEVWVGVAVLDGCERPVPLLLGGVVVGTLLLPLVDGGPPGLDPVDVGVVGRTALPEPEVVATVTVLEEVAE